MSRILDNHPEILKLAYEDLKQLSQGNRKGRRGDFTSETLLRALIVHAIEGLSFRETEVRVVAEQLRHYLPSMRKKSMNKVRLRSVVPLATFAFSSRATGLVVMAVLFFTATAWRRR